MKIIKKSPESFWHSGDKKTAILLIHGFTGSPAELSLLGSFLKEKGYAVYAPLLTGHGQTPEIMAKTKRQDWWQSVLTAYDVLREKGYQDILAIGLSMGGILAFKLALERELKAVVSMAAPIMVFDKRMGYARWIKYLRAFKIKEPKEKHIEARLASYDRTPVVCVEELHKLIREVKGEITKITIPTLVMQGNKDETVIPESANYIFDQISSQIKDLRWYEQTSHIMTLDHEKEIIYADILAFLERIQVN